MKTNIDFANLLETYFTDRLQRQRQASPHTVASYRDTFCPLLRYARQRSQGSGLRYCIKVSVEPVP